MKTELPIILPVPMGVNRPLWSVMIPTYNCARYLRETLESVLAQDPGPDHMQIAVVDDCSTADDPEALVRQVGRGRVQFLRNTKNKGAIETFNTCIQHSTGQLIHILHGDDLVGQSYYEFVADLARRNPELGIFATRCFLIDEESIPVGLSGRVRELEDPGKSPESFFYQTPIQFAGVTVRRSSYEALGGFRSDLVHAADCEMWARVFANHGGIISPRVLASYRTFAGNDSSRLVKTGENVRDLCRLHEIFAHRYPAFSKKVGRARASRIAWNQYINFKLQGDQSAAEANRALWVELTPLRWRIERRIRRVAQQIMVSQ